MRPSTSRKRLHSLVYALLVCLALLWAFGAFVAVRHLADVLRAGAVVPALPDAVALVAIAAGITLTVLVGREVAAVGERRAGLTRELAAGLGDLLVRVARGQPVDHTGGAGRLAADQDDSLRTFAHAYAAAAGAALSHAAA